MKKKDVEVEWFTEKRKVSDLKFHPRNPRTLSKKSHDDLLKSFNKYNYAELVAINKDNTILAGHQRISIMKELGWEDKEIEVRVPNVLLSKRDADGYLLISNKVSGDWDMDIMANQWEMEELIEGGFTEEELYGKIQEEEKDSSINELDLNQRPILEISCDSQEHQRKLYEEMSSRGLECRILNL